MDIRHVYREDRFTEVAFKLDRGEDATTIHGFAFFEGELLMDVKSTNPTFTLTQEEKKKLYQKTRLHILLEDEGGYIDEFYERMMEIKLIKDQIPLEIQKHPDEKYGHIYSIFIDKVYEGKKYRHLGDKFYIGKYMVHLPSVKEVHHEYSRQIICENDEDLVAILKQNGYHVANVNFSKKKPMTWFSR